MVGPSGRLPYSSRSRSAPTARLCDVRTVHKGAHHEVPRHHPAAALEDSFSRPVAPLTDTEPADELSVRSPVRRATRMRTRAMTMSFGVQFPCALPPEELLGWARGCEDAGFDEFYIVEDCFFAAGISSVTAALAATSRVKVGLGIVPTVARNAAFTALAFGSSALVCGLMCWCGGKRVGRERRTRHLD